MVASDLIILHQKRFLSCHCRTAWDAFVSRNSSVVLFYFQIGNTVCNHFNLVLAIKFTVSIAVPNWFDFADFLQNTNNKRRDDKTR